jgi:methanogenic corrinoid protein MtbC1
VTQWSARHLHLASELRALLQNADVAGIRSALCDAQRSAESTAAYVEQILVPFEHMVGSLCQDDLLTAEFAARASRLVGELLVTSPPDVDPLGVRPTLWVGCPRGEWHDLPARMMRAVVVEQTDWRVVHLGPSVSDESFGAAVRAANRPTVVAVSCTMSMHLTAAASAVHTVQLAGVPVVVGGAAFGTTEKRAHAIGADQWCRDLATLAQTLHAWERRPPEAPQHTSSSNAAVLSELTRARMIDAALRSLGRSDGALRVPELESDRTPRRLHGLLSLAEAAVLTDDLTVLTEGIVWWSSAMRAREIAPGPYLSAAFEALSTATEPGALRSLLLHARSLAGEV